MHDIASHRRSHSCGHATVVALKTLTVPPYTTTNAVLFGTKQFVIIDPGASDHDEQEFICQCIQSRIDRSQQFIGVLLTHNHQDHSSAASLISQRFQVPLYAHALTASHVPFVIDSKITDQQEIHLHDAVRLRALHTPGHSEDHVVYYDPQDNILVAGDMITDRGTILIPPESGSLSIYLRSLTNLTTLKLRAVIPAHGAVIDTKPVQFLLHALQHRYQRICAIFDTLFAKRDTALDATDITRLVYKDVDNESILRFAQLSVESSLKWLREHHMLEQDNYKWICPHTVNADDREKILTPLNEIKDRLRHS